MGAVVQAIAFAVIALLGAAWMTGVVNADLSLYRAMRVMMWIAFAVIALDQLVVMSAQPRETVEGAPASSSRWPAFAIAIRRDLVTIAVGLTLFVMGRSILAEALGLIAIVDWNRGLQAIGGGVFVLIVGYIAYEALKAWGGARMRPAGGGRSLDEEADTAPASRLGTVLPLLSGILIAATVGVAALLLLSELGVNIGPILAGAGIFGLAFSFGAQSLARDVISGAFFMSGSTSSRAATRARSKRSACAPCGCAIRTARSTLRRTPSLAR